MLDLDVPFCRFWNSIPDRSLIRVTFPSMFLSSCLIVFRGPGTNCSGWKEYWILVLEKILENTMAMPRKQTNGLLNKSTTNSHLKHKWPVLNYLSWTRYAETYLSGEGCNAWKGRRKEKKRMTSSKVDGQLHWSY